jgi:hypothetical protein
VKRGVLFIIEGKHATEVLLDAHDGPAADRWCMRVPFRQVKKGAVKNRVFHEVAVA